MSAAVTIEWGVGGEFDRNVTRCVECDMWQWQGHSDGSWLHINDVFTALTWCTWDNSHAQLVTAHFYGRGFNFNRDPLTCAMRIINQTQIYKWIECAT